MQDFGRDVTNRQSARQTQQLTKFVVLFLNGDQFERGDRRRVAFRANLRKAGGVGAEELHLVLERQKRRENRIRDARSDGLLNRSRCYTRGNGQENARDERERVAT